VTTIHEKTTSRRCLLVQRVKANMSQLHSRAEVVRISRPS
jgi:hypothetical protein